MPHICLRAPFAGYNISLTHSGLVVGGKLQGHTVLSVSEGMYMYVINGTEQLQGQ